jgi:sugar O-acyltransferase (sialic acid O-acetyltransferase NeuD family)
MSDPSSLGIYGAGGFGREILPLAVHQLRQVHGDDGDVCFVDDMVEDRAVNGVAVRRFDEFVSYRSGVQKRIAIAIANPLHRARLATKCMAAGLLPFSVFSATSQRSSDSELGEGAILCPYSLITVNSKIGRFFHANFYSYVAHDCLIGDFVTFAPAVKCNGHVIIEDGAYIGTGAILLGGRKGAPLLVGRGAVVAAGAVVMRNVPPENTVVGNPARPLPRM